MVLLVGHVRQFNCGWTVRPSEDHSYYWTPTGNHSLLQEFDGTICSPWVQRTCDRGRHFWNASDCCASEGTYYCGHLILTFMWIICARLLLQLLQLLWLMQLYRGYCSITDQPLQNDVGLSHLRAMLYWWSRRQYIDCISTCTAADWAIS